MIARCLLIATSLAVATPPVSPARAADTKAEQAQQIWFPEDADGPAVLAAALASAAETGKIAVVVFGADWCHDSQSLARVLSSSAFATEFGDRFAVTFIDVGTPQIGEGRNLDLAARFGIDRMRNTPAMIAVSPEGRRLNSTGDARSWRNAESRTQAAIFDWFREIAERSDARSRR